MTKKLVSCILTVCMLLTMLPTMAWAEEANVLDVAKGPIRITDAGWEQTRTDGLATGTDLDVTISGTTTDPANVVTIDVDTAEPTITLKDLNMTCRKNYVLGPVIISGGTIVLSLEGANVLDGGGNGSASTCLGALTIQNSANVTIQGTGSLEAKGFQRSAGIYVQNGSTLTIESGTINATGGSLFSAAGIGASDFKPAGTIIIKGGNITTASSTIGTCNTQAATKVAISGTATVKAKTIAANTVEITGGTVICDEYPTIDGKQLVKLAFYDMTTGAALADTEVTVDTWTAVTDANGVVYMYLADGATSVTATVEGESEAREAVIKNGEALFAPACTCTAGSGTIEWVGSFEEITLYKGVTSRVFDISAKYVAGSNCKAPVHGDFETVTITDNSDYASHADGKLTVNTHTASYEVTLNANANGVTAEPKTIKVTIESKKGFNLMDGAITFDGTKYTQDGVDYTPAVGEQVVVYGSGTTDNYLEVTAGTANVILDNVDIKATGGSYMDAKGIIRVFGGKLNLTLTGENTLERGRGGLINVGKVDSNNADDAVITIDCVEDDCGDADCPHTLKLITGFSGENAISALIGGYTGHAMSGTVNISGGSIIIPEVCGVGIGSPRASTSASVEYHYDVNISGGSVDIEEVHKLGVGIGMGCGADENSEVNVNITGGNVDVASTYDGTSEPPVGIGAAGYAKGDMNIAIGGNADVNVAVWTGIAIGVQGNSWAPTDIKISGGSVTAESKNIAIGTTLTGAENRGAAACNIEISGGDVTATGTAVAIGVVGPAGYPDTATGVNRTIDASVEISGDAKVTATAKSVAVGMTRMGANSKMDIEISDTAVVEAVATNVATDEDGDGVADTKAGVAIGTTVGEHAAKYDAEPAVGSTSIAITSPSVTVQAEQPIAASTETALEEGTTYTIKTEDGALTVEIPEGASGTVSDSSVTLPKGTELTDESGKKATVAEKVTVAAEQTNNLDVADDAVSLPEGATITKADGSSVNLSEGGTMAADGAITAGGTVTTKDAEGNTVSTVVVPEGQDATVSADGKVTAPAGTVVTDKDGKENTLTNGGTVDKDGAVTETKPPYSGGYYPSYTPSVTPAAPSVDSSSLNNAALAVGSAIKDGSAEFTPVNGYTKDEVLQLQKDGKLRMGIEKTVGYGSVAEKNLADAAIKSAGGAVSGTSVMYFDITPVLKLDNGTVVAHVTDTEKAITITIELSDELTKAAKDGKDIAVVRVHDGKAEFLSAKLNAAKTKVTFSSADFSTYAVVALNKATSAKTFDAGVAMYVGMAVLAATGSAVVIGKKRK